MGVQTLHIVGLTVANQPIDAIGRLQIRTFGDDRSWRATFRVLVLPTFGPRTQIDQVVITTSEGTTLFGQATFLPIELARVDGRLWLSATGSGAFELV